MRNSTRSSSLSTLARSCRLRRPRRKEDGATLVEFAIILPVFALMLFGMIQFGLAFAGWDELRNAVQTSARLAANSQAIPSNPNCGQPDPGSNLICQVALSIGAPVDTAPTPVDTLPLSETPTEPSAYSCSSPLQSCTGPGGGYAWLDGYYIFENGQWLQIVSGNASGSDQINDTQAFDDGVGTWSCASSNCTAITTNVTGQNQNALASDNIAINVDTTPYQLQVCAQRQIVSFTALPGVQALHLSTSSTFYLALTATSTTMLCPGQAPGAPCSYESAAGVICG
jgi:Flp pilus assembly protein TadG